MQNTLEILEVSIGDAICGVASSSEPSKSTYMLLESKSQPILDVATAKVADEKSENTKLLFPNFKGEANKKAEKPKDDQDVLEISEANTEQYNVYKKERDELDADFKKLMEQRSKLYMEITRAPDGTRVQKEVVEPYYNACMTFRGKHNALNDTYKDLQVEPSNDIKSRMDLLLEPSEWDAIQWPVNIKERLVMPTGDYTDPAYLKTCERLRENRFFILLASDEDVMKVATSLLWSYINSVEKNVTIRNTSSLDSEAENINNYLINSKIILSNRSLQYAYKLQLNRLRLLQKIAKSYRTVGLKFDEDFQSWTQDTKCIHAVEKCLEVYERYLKMKNQELDDEEVGVDVWKKRANSLMGVIQEAQKLDLFKDQSAFGDKIPPLKLQNTVLENVILDSKHTSLMLDWICAMNVMFPDDELDQLTYDEAYKEVIDDTDIDTMIKEYTILAGCNKLDKKSHDEKIELVKKNIEIVSTRYKALIAATKNKMEKTSESEPEASFNKRREDYEKKANETLDKFVKEANRLVAIHEQK